MSENVLAERQWRDAAPRPFAKAERETTTLWVVGFTHRHDEYLCAAGRGLGYKMRAMPIPDNESLKIGKEFGNRGQCNPTYYTSGNLIRKLRELEAEGVPKDEIIRNHVLITVGSCGPCRFGMYATEYRKALREAGYDGFRIVQLRQTDITSGDFGGEGLDINLRAIVHLVKAVIAADVVSILGHRIRPYEIVAGATDGALGTCDQIVIAALERRQSILKALRRCRRVLQGVAVDRLRAKPVVCVIGEIWAMTTEGDGNYRMHRFIEDEGAEVIVEPIYNWLLYLFWEQRRDVSIRRFLRDDDPGNRGLQGKSAWTRLLVSRAVEPVLRATIRSFAATAGLADPQLADIDEMAGASHEHYDCEVRGGEGFMEVGKFLDAAEQKLAHLVVSVKPFGCMPSSGVSDGVQSLLSARNPETAFYAIETTGDGRTSVYSRIQMMLYNAHKRAQAEFRAALDEAGLDEAEARRRLRRDRKLACGTFAPRRRYPTTAANIVSELA